MGESHSLLELATRAHAAFEINLTGVTGLENLERLPKSQPVIITPDHLSDISIETVISKIEPLRRVAVADEAANLTVPIKGILTQWIAGGRLLPITTRPEINKMKHRQSLHKFVLEDYVNIAKVMENKIPTVIIAAHRPVYGDHIQLPRHPGLGSVTLASLTHAPIVPSALIIEGKEDEIVENTLHTATKLITGRRPKARLIYGEPVIIDFLTHDELQLATDYQNIDNRAKSGPPRDEQARAYSKLYLQGEKVMRALAKLLPEDKRGVWGESAIQEVLPPEEGSGRFLEK